MHRSSWKQESHLHLPLWLCSSILSEIVERSIVESESASFYRREIQKCQEYISLVQAEATHTWEPPSKPEEFENIEDVQFFQSEFCLKNKLTLLQQDRERSESRRKISQLSHNNHIRGSVRPRASSMSVFAWSEHRYSSHKQQNQNKLRQKKNSRQASLQKLAITQKEAPTRSEKELREAILHPPINQANSKKKPYRKMVFRKKEQPPAEDDGNIPILVQIGYNITQQAKLRSLEKKESLPKLQQAQKKLEKMQSTLSSVKGQTNGRRLVISEYEPNRSQIKVSSWRKFNQLLEVKHEEPPANPQQFSNINYFTEITTL